jgi:soluble lytic murein transglycosylase-like protein
VRVSESVEVVREPIAFSVMSVPDPTLIRGKSVVVTAGVPGLAENTYRLTFADGSLEQRTLVASTELQAPIAAVSRVGTQAPPVPGDIESIIRAAAANWGADPDQLLRVAWCESRYNPNAYNAASGASGLFQFMPRTFALNSVRAGYGGASIFDPVASANTAAMMFASGQARQWSCK